MEPSLNPVQARLLAEALAIGLLVGIERYKDRDPGEQKTAGVRTFAAFALLGGICGLLDNVGLAVAGFAAIVILVAIGYVRESTHSIGLTTETAAFIVFWLGYLVHSHEALAIATAIVLTIMLASKQSMHSFVSKTLSERELFDTLKFLAVVLVIYPLLPDRAIGPFGFFNPAKTWLLIALVSTIAYVGYFLVRFLGAKRGLWVSAVLGGIVSTTATTMALAGRAREEPGSSSLLGPAAIAANAIQFPRLLVLVAVVDAAFGRHLLPVLAAMTGVGLLVAAALMARRGDADRTVELAISNPYSVTPALRFGALFVVGLFAIRLAETSLGETGVFAASILGGVASVSAVALSLSEITVDGSLSLTAATTALLLAILSNAAVKWAMAWIQGTRRLALWLGAGLALMIATGLLLAWAGSPLLSP